MTNEPSTDWRLAKAQRSLAAAGRAVEAGDAETAVSRAYYAAYHAVIAVLEARTDLTVPRRHAELHNLLRSSLADALLGAGDVREFGLLFKLRQTADYEDERIDLPVAEAAVKSDAEYV